MGCSDSLNLKPCDGESSTGAVMVTPGIGPATVGAVGVELLDVWQPPSASRRRPHETFSVRSVMANLDRQTSETAGRTHVQRRAVRLSAEVGVSFRESGLLGSVPGG